MAVPEPETPMRFWVDGLRVCFWPHSGLIDLSGDMTVELARTVVAMNVLFLLMEIALSLWHVDKDWGDGQAAYEGGEGFVFMGP